MKKKKIIDYHKDYINFKYILIKDNKLNKYMILLNTKDTYANMLKEKKERKFFSCRFEKLPDFVKKDKKAELKEKGFLMLDKEEYNITYKNHKRNENRNRELIASMKPKRKILTINKDNLKNIS